jgi:hypothetical protein
MSASDILYVGALRCCWPIGLAPEKTWEGGPATTNSSPAANNDGRHGTKVGTLRRCDEGRWMRNFTWCFDCPSRSFFGRRKSARAVEKLVAELIITMSETARLGEESSIEIKSKIAYMP